MTNRPCLGVCDVYVRLAILLHIIIAAVFRMFLYVSLQIIATRAGDVDMVSLLVGVAGSDVNKASYVARSRAIHWASSSDCDGSIECLRVLLDVGADVEARVASGRTAVMLAARAGHLHAVQLLIRHGTSRVHVLERCHVCTANILYDIIRTA